MGVGVEFQFTVLQYRLGKSYACPPDKRQVINNYFVAL